MSEFWTQGRKSQRGWAAPTIGAVAIIALVAGVWVATNRSTGSDLGAGSGPGVSAPMITSTPDSGPATAVTLFQGDIVEADTSRTVAVDVAGAWPVRTCASAATDTSRVDFVSGTETGPEYSRDLAMGWYVDEVSAKTAYDRIWAQVEACAASSGATLENVPGTLGAQSLVATVAQPGVGGEVAVSTYVITRVDAVVVMAIDHATFRDDSVPAPSEATTTIEHAARLVAELCRAEPARC